VEGIEDPAELAVPITVKEETVAVIDVGGMEPNIFDTATSRHWKPSPTN
jgi:putative methionine-R-sulfoxide reductase with GAF domain